MPPAGPQAACSRWCSRPRPPAAARAWQRRDGTVCARIEAVDEGSAHDRLIEMLGLRLDTRPFLALAAADPLLAPLVLRMRGRRAILASTPEQALIRAVCGR